MSTLFTYMTKKDPLSGFGVRVFSSRNQQEAIKQYEDFKKHHIVLETNFRFDHEEGFYQIEAIHDKAKEEEIFKKVLDEYHKIFTCYDCPLKDTCEFAWDHHNVDGNCIADK